MLRIRVIPCLLLSGGGLVKTVKFRTPRYVGDPVNIVRIFNELEVDELVLQDIDATPKGQGINFELLEDIASECFMPFTYGGGISSVEEAKRLFGLGAEKIIVNTHAFSDPRLVSSLAERFGSQAVVASVDVKKDLWGRYHVYSQGGRVKTAYSPVPWARRLEEFGVGEVLLSSIDRDGTFGGYDIKLIRQVSDALSIPVIASGGASCLDDLRQAVCEGGASALGVGSMVVFQGPGRGVLTNFPKRDARNSLVERA